MALLESHTFKLEQCGFYRRYVNPKDLSAICARQLISMLELPEKLPKQILVEVHDCPGVDRLRIDDTRNDPYWCFCRIDGIYVAVYHSLLVAVNHRLVKYKKPIFVKVKY